HHYWHSPPRPTQSLTVLLLQPPALNPQISTGSLPAATVPPRHLNFATYDGVSWPSSVKPRVRVTRPNYLTPWSPIPMMPTPSWASTLNGPCHDMLAVASA